jgi:ribosomal-protein-alanine N-acetyltransferase
MPPLETPRLLIRPFVAEDLPVFAALISACFPGAPADVEAYRDQVAYNALAHRVQQQLRQPPFGDRAIVLKETNTLIGSIGLVHCLAPFQQLASQGQIRNARFTPEVGLFWAVHPGHRRNGYATEAALALIHYAAEHLRLQRIVATTESDNLASISVMHRLGMAIERNPGGAPEWFQVTGTLQLP